MANRGQLYELLLKLNYEDLAKSCQYNPESAEICRDPAFWEAKANRDFGKSLREINIKGTTPAEEKYLALLSEEDITFGSEKYKQPEILAERAVKKGRTDLLNYFVEQGNVDTTIALVEATRDTDLFYQLLSDFGLVNQDNITLLDQYPEIYYPVFLAAIKNQNLELVGDLAPRASEIFTNTDERKQILASAASTGNYDLVEYLFSLFNPDLQDYSLNGWYLQAALLNQDDDAIESLINGFLDTGDYIELALTFVRAGSYERLNNLIQLINQEGLPIDISELGKRILMEAVSYDRLAFVKFVAKNPFFNLVKRRSWFENAADLAKELENSEIETYLNSVLLET